MQHSQDTDRISKSKIPLAIQALKELKSKELPDVPAKEAIRLLRRYIEGALKKNYTYLEISELLAGLDIHISDSRLKYLLGEVKKSSILKKKKLDEPQETAVSIESEVTVNQETISSQDLTHNSSKKGTINSPEVKVQKKHLKRKNQIQRVKIIHIPLSLNSIVMTSYNHNLLHCI